MTIFLSLNFVFLIKNITLTILWEYTYSVNQIILFKDYGSALKVILF